MDATWEVTHEPNGDMDEVFVAYASRIVLRSGSPGHWALTIDLAEGGCLTVDFRSVHGIRGTFEIDEIPPRCPWSGPLSTPLIPSSTAQYRVKRGGRGRFLALDVRGPNFLHVERLEHEVFWMAMSMPAGDYLVSRLFSAAKIVGEPRHEPGIKGSAPSRPAKRLPRRPRRRPPDAKRERLDEHLGPAPASLARR